LQGCAAVSGGSEAITGMKQLMGVCRTPVVGVGGGDLDRSGKCDELTEVIGVSRLRRFGAGERHHRAKHYARHRSAKRTAPANNQNL
jgi:hypothetical protein